MKTPLLPALLLGVLPMLAQLPAPNAAGVSAGHDIMIEGAQQDSAGIEIVVRRSEPAPGCPVASAMTQPVDLARMRADRRAVRFRERQVVVPCSRP